MAVLKDITGQAFGRLTVVRRVEAKWLCVCTCGREVQVITASLNNGNTRSCGCLFKESVSKNGRSAAARCLPKLRKNEVTQTLVLSLFDYAAETGELHWRAAVNTRAPKGSVAGKNSKNFGYKSLGIGSATYRTHHVVWLYHTGCWPTGEIDHINGVRDDNRIENLREVSRTVNAQNLKGPHKNNKSGYLGVSARKQGWIAQIRHNGKKLYLGSFQTAPEAFETYLSAKRCLHLGNTL